ncbi:MAG: hypothetical protein AAGG53_01375 [Cyanobacteria bacterium P01_H01_bin.152]
MDKLGIVEESESWGVGELGSRRVGESESWGVGELGSRRVGESGSGDPEFYDLRESHLNDILPTLLPIHPATV